MTNIDTTSFPILTTERLALRQLSMDDSQAIYALRSDPDVNKYLDRSPCMSLEDATNFITKINENIEKGNAYYWAITLKETKDLVGTICLFDFSTENDSCEIGFELIPKYQRQGLMKEAAQVVVDFVFETLSFSKIFAYTHRDNQDSRQLLSNLYFVKGNDSGIPDIDVFRFEKSQVRNLD